MLSGSQYDLPKNVLPKILHKTILDWLFYQGLNMPQLKKFSLNCVIRQNISVYLFYQGSTCSVRKSFPQIYLQDTGKYLRLAILLNPPRALYESLPQISSLDTLKYITIYSIKAYISCPTRKISPQISSLDTRKYLIKGSTCPTRKISPYIS